MTKTLSFVSSWFSRVFATKQFGRRQITSTVINFNDYDVLSLVASFYKLPTNSTSTNVMLTIVFSDTLDLVNDFLFFFK